MAYLSNKTTAGVTSTVVKCIITAARVNTTMLTTAYTQPLAHPHRPMRPKPPRSHHAVTTVVQPPPAPVTTPLARARFLSKPSGFEAEILGSGAVPLALGVITRASASPQLRNAGIGMLGTLAHEHTERKMATERKHAAAVDAARQRADERTRRGHVLARELQAQLDTGAISAAAPTTRISRESRDSSDAVDSDATTENGDDDEPPGGGDGAPGGGDNATTTPTEQKFDYANLPKPCASSSIFFASKKVRFLESLPARRAGRYAWDERVRPGGGKGKKKLTSRGARGAERASCPCLPEPKATGQVGLADQQALGADECDFDLQLQREREGRFTV